MASFRTRIETALVTAFSAACANIYPGTESREKILPCLIVRAVSAEDITPLGGRFLVTCEITVKADAASPDFDTICAAVKSISDAPGFAASLTSSTLFVYGIGGTSRVEWGTEGDSWTESRTLALECAPQP